MIDRLCAIENPTKLFCLYRKMGKNDCKQRDDGWNRSIIMIEYAIYAICD